MDIVDKYAMIENNNGSNTFLIKRSEFWLIWGKGYFCGYFRNSDLGQCYFNVIGKQYSRVKLQVWCSDKIFHCTSYNSSLKRHG